MQISIVRLNAYKHSNRAIKDKSKRTARFTRIIFFIDILLTDNIFFLKGGKLMT